MIISLAGFMGAGKSAVGRELASLLGWDFVDLDNYVAMKTGRSIGDLLAEGETYFRAVEGEALRDVVSMREVTGGNLVLALGGGTLTTAPLLDMMLEKTVCVYLRANVGTLLARIGKDRSERPLLPGSEDAVAALLASRDPLYSKAPVQIDTDGLTPAETAFAVSTKIRNFVEYGERVQMDIQGAGVTRKG